LAQIRLIRIYVKNFCNLADTFELIRLKLPAQSNETETKVKQNCFKTVFFSRNVLPVLANHCRYPPFARQTRGEGGATTYA